MRSRLISLLRPMAAVLAVLALWQPLGAQTAGSIGGTVVDAQGAAVPNAKVVLVNNDQGAASARDVRSGGEGTFLFTPVQPGGYSVSVEVPGFKTYTQAGIRLNVNDRLGLPPITLEVGATNESVTVEANAVQLETVTAERSGVVTGKQMVDIALNGRNYTTLLKTIPGSSADATGGNASFNGQRNNQNNFTIDGQTVIDIGVNEQFAYRVNVDAIQEFKVSTNGQSAEFGRNSGAQIQVVTKSGTNQFHGAGWWFKRGEFMNANSFTNNAQRIQRPLYRFMTAGYTLGGPVVIPGKFNTGRDKLFFFMSHEWNRAIQPNTLRQITVPTLAERGGDFSNGALDASGNRQTILDPLTRSAANPTGLPFAGNIIPASRFNEHGPSVLNWLPRPNAAAPNYNYQSQAANEDPSFDQIYRGDYNINDKWRMFGRYINSKQTQTRPYGRLDTSNVLGLTPFYAPTFGWSLWANIATIISPTLTNEVQFGYTVNGIPGDPPPAGSPYYRSVSKINVPLLYPGAEETGVIPNFDFGGVPTVSGTQMTTFAGTPYANRNPLWNVTDNVSKSLGVHTLKFGLFYEYAVKTENSLGRPYNSTISFARDSNNPGDANWAFANALLGNYNSYTQISGKPLPSFPYNSAEFYGQDTWKVNRKLTLNYGLRVVYALPFYEKNNLMSNFEYSRYDPAKAVTFFQPAGAASGPNRRALNPLTGELLPAPYIGAIVPNFGNINNGLVRSNEPGGPRGILQSRGAQWGPRFGLAYQIDNKTVLRLGGGAFYERITTGNAATGALALNPPLYRTAQIFYGNLSNIASAGGIFFPTAVTRVSSEGKIPTVYNYNFGIQRQLPMQLFLDASYVGSQSRHLALPMPFNNVGFGSAWLPSTQDPTRTPLFDGSTTLQANTYRPYAGYTAQSDNTFGASANYNALQVAVNKRRGALQMGVAYTWSKALGVIQGHLTNARATSYGPLAVDRTQSLSFNYIYDIPSLARKDSFLDNAPGRLVFDGWQLSGLTSMSVGAPVNLTYQGATTQLNRTITGSEDNAPRLVLNCNPNLPRDTRNINAYIDTNCVGPALKGSTQNDSGLNRLRGPGINQWDMNLFKNIKLGADGARRLQLRLEAYNAFNHTQWATFNGSAQFNAAGKVSNLPTQLGGTGGLFGFGALNSIRANSQRILQVAAKIYF
jgi:hypothetical protein